MSGGIEETDASCAKKHVRLGRNKEGRTRERKKGRMHRRTDKKLICIDKAGRRRRSGEGKGARSLALVENLTADS